MKMNWVTLTVNNLDDSLAFYKDIIGLQERRRMMEEGAEIAFLGDGETKLELVCDPNNQCSEQKDDISLGFSVNSLFEMLEFMNEKGVPIHSGPFQPNNRIKFFYVLDPDGLKIQFSESIA